MLLFIILAALIGPILVVFFWQKRPVIAFLIAIIMYLVLLIAPGVIQTFQAMMIYGTGDPQLVAGGIASTLAVGMAGTVIGIPILAVTQWLGRRRYKSKLSNINAKQTFE